MGIGSSNILKCYQPILVASVIAWPLSMQAFGHELSMKAGFYKNNDNIQRMRQDLGLSYESKAPRNDCDWGVSTNVARSRYEDRTAVSDETAKESYESGRRTEESGTVGYSATCGRLTDFRISQNWLRDEALRNQTTSVGLSRWFIHETIQFSLDLSRTFVKRPVYEYLDTDSELVSPPRDYDSTGTTFALKHLATATTVTRYSLGTIWSNDRPPMRVYQVGIRQFIPKFNGAVHGDVGRVYNRGRVSPDSTFGEVDAWVLELAYLQTLGPATRARLGWRQYLESETTRATKDEFLMGSDMVSISIDRDLKKLPVNLTVAAAHYQTNEVDDEGKQIFANTVESGVTARF